MNRKRAWRHCVAIVFLWLALCAPVLAQRAWWSAQQLLEQTTAPRVTLLKDGAPVDTVERDSIQRAITVIERLASTYGMPTPEVVIEAASTPNAFATIRNSRPLVGINTEMLRLVGADEDDLAVIMGHELGHLQARHTTDGAQRAAVVSVLGAVLGAMIDINQARRGRDTGGVGAALGGIGAGLVNAKFSRDQEREADRLGIHAMARSGYNPARASAMWRLMEERGGGGSGLWLSSHPSHAEREAELASLARDLLPTYAANREIHEQAPAVAPPEPSRTLVVAVPEKSQATAPSGVSLATPVEALTAPYAVRESASQRERLAEYAERAGGGDLAALAQLSLLYVTGGGGVEKDYPKARTYSERSAQAGDPLGQAVYGALLRDGIAGSGDPVRGLQMLVKSAEAGVPWAHYQLGIAYEQGLGVRRNRETALSHYKAAAQSMSEARERAQALDAR